MPQRYAARRRVPPWKFWVLRKWEVYRVNQPWYYLTGFTKRRATAYVHEINVAGGFTS